MMNDPRSPPRPPPASPRIALGHVTREYPHKLDHVMDGPEDVLGPRALHPIFFGSFDWHSCVHGYWLLLRTLRLFPEPAERRADRGAARRDAGPGEGRGRASPISTAPIRAAFERPYGWAWLLDAARRGAARTRTRPGPRRWRPLAEAFAERFKVYLPKLTYPVRAGTHFNTAFALIARARLGRRRTTPRSAA